jgi:diaminohydroxyphosphoribosylaminopyrimidine deaminase/5-amino-6-(5-phosphoribosylamino)uracil reductase
VVVAGERPLPVGAAVLRRDPVVLAPAPGASPRGAVVLPGPGGVDLEAAMRHLGGLGVVDLLVEGGPTLSGALLRAGLVDRLVAYLAGRVAGGTGLPAFGGEWATLSDSVDLTIVAVERVGPDLRIEAVPRVR